MAKNVKNWSKIEILVKNMFFAQNRKIEQKSILVKPTLISIILSQYYANFIKF